MLWVSKQAISIELAATVDHVVPDLDLDFADISMSGPTCFFINLCFTFSTDRKGKVLMTVHTHDYVQMYRNC